MELKYRPLRGEMPGEKIRPTAIIDGLEYEFDARTADAPDPEFYRADRGWVLLGEGHIVTVHGIPIKDHFPGFFYQLRPGK